MSRSIKKGPYVDEKLLKKILAQKNNGAKGAIKTWARASVVAPEFIGHTLSIHQGKKFVDVFISETMVGHKLGEFAPTRTFKGHGRIVKRVLTKT
jgi:small subunit ribosomal protein S19